MKFILSEKAEELVKSSGIGMKIRIFMNEHIDEFNRATKIIYMSSTLRKRIHDLSKKGFYSQQNVAAKDELNLCVSYTDNLLRFIMLPDAMHWKYGSDSKKLSNELSTEFSKQSSNESFKELLLDNISMQSSLFVLSGMPLSFVLDTFPNYEKLGFSSFTEMLGTCGAYMLDIKENTASNNGLVWKNSFDGVSVLNRIENKNYGETFVHQYNSTIDNIIDPFGNAVHYKPVTPCNHKMLDITNRETSYLIMLLKYADASGVRESVISEIKEKYVVNGKNGTPERLPLDSQFVADQSIAKLGNPNTFKLPHKNGSCCVYIGKENELLIGGSNFMCKDFKPEISYTKEDISLAITALMSLQGDVGSHNPRELKTVLRMYAERRFKT